MILDAIPRPTDKVVLDTLVFLVRHVPWGPGRDALDQEASSRRAACEEASAEDRKAWKTLQFGAIDDTQRKDLVNYRGEIKDYLEPSLWYADLLALAAQSRFPREGDTAAHEFVTEILYELGDIARGVRPWGFREKQFRIALDGAIAAAGVLPGDLPLPPEPIELMDIGGDRPEYVTEEHWKEVEKNYYRKMTIDNTPSEFIYGEP